MILRIGAGSRRTSVGMARMSSLARQLRVLDEVDDLDLVAARRGARRRASVRLANARSDLGDWPATYRRRCQTSSSRRRAPSEPLSVPSRRCAWRPRRWSRRSRRGSSASARRSRPCSARCPARSSAPVEPWLSRRPTTSASSSNSRHRAAVWASTDSRRRLEVDPALLEVLQPGGAVGALLGLLGLAGRAGEHALRPDVDVGQLDALVGEQELADLVGVGHAAGLEDVEDPVVLAVALHGLDQEPGVDQRRDLLVGLGRARRSEFRLVNSAVTPLRLQEVDLAGQHRGHVAPGADAQEVGDRVHDDDGGVELADQLLHGEQVRLEAEQAGAEAVELEQAGVHPLLQVDAHRRHVPHDLAPRTPRRRSRWPARRGCRWRRRTAPPGWTCRCRRCR